MLLFHLFSAAAAVNKKLCDRRQDKSGNKPV